MNYLSIETPIGKLTIAGTEAAVTNVYWYSDPENQIEACAYAQASEKTAEASENLQTAVPAILRAAAEQLFEYFRGERREFDIPLDPAGGEFFQRVWGIMRSVVPFGTTVSYSALAALAGKPRAARAVGMANNRNPIPIFIPCHRVVGKDGSLVGFRSGVDVKAKLLALERG